MSFLNNRNDLLLKQNILQQTNKQTTSAKSTQKVENQQAVQSQTSQNVTLQSLTSSYTAGKTSAAALKNGLTDLNATLSTSTNSSNLNVLNGKLNGKNITVISNTPFFGNLNQNSIKSYTLAELRSKYGFSIDVITKYFEPVDSLNTFASNFSYVSINGNKITSSSKLTAAENLRCNQMNMNNVKYRLKSNGEFSTIEQLQQHLAKYSSYRNDFILDNFLDNKNRTSNSASDLYKTSSGKTLTAANYDEYINEIGLATGNDAQKLRKQALDKLIKDFSLGNLAYAQVSTILNAIGVSNIKQNTAGNNYTFTFSYEGKNYSITCNKKAAAKGSDDVQVKTYTAEDYNNIYEDIRNEYLEPSVTMGQEITTYVLKSGKTEEQLAEAIEKFKASIMQKEWVDGYAPEYLIKEFFETKNINGQDVYVLKKDKTLDDFYAACDSTKSTTMPSTADDLTKGIDNKELNAFFDRLCEMYNNESNLITNILASVTGNLSGDAQYSNASYDSLQLRMDNYLSEIRDMYEESLSNSYNIPGYLLDEILERTVNSVKEIFLDNINTQNNVKDDLELAAWRLALKECVSPAYYDVINSITPADLNAIEILQKVDTTEIGDCEYEWTNYYDWLEKTGHEDSNWAYERYSVLVAIQQDLGPTSDTVRTVGHKLDMSSPSGYTVELIYEDSSKRDNFAEKYMQYLDEVTSIENLQKAMSGATIYLENGKFIEIDLDRYGLDTNDYITQTTLLQPVYGNADIPGREDEITKFKEIEGYSINTQRLFTEFESQLLSSVSSTVSELSDVSDMIELNRSLYTEGTDFNKSVLSIIRTKYPTAKSVSDYEDLLNDVKNSCDYTNEDYFTNALSFYLKYGIDEKIEAKKTMEKECLEYGARHVSRVLSSFTWCNPRDSVNLYDKVEECIDRTKDYSPYSYEDIRKVVYNMCTAYLTDMYADKYSESEFSSLLNKGLDYTEYKEAIKECLETGNDAISNWLNDNMEEILSGDKHQALLSSVDSAKNYNTEADENLYGADIIRQAYQDAVTNKTAFGVQYLSDYLNQYGYLSSYKKDLILCSFMNSFEENVQIGGGSYKNELLSAFYGEGLNLSSKNGEVISGTSTIIDRTINDLICESFVISKTPSRLDIQINDMKSTMNAFALNQKCERALLEDEVKSRVEGLSDEEISNICDIIEQSVDSADGNLSKTRSAIIVCNLINEMSEALGISTSDAYNIGAFPTIYAAALQANKPNTYIEQMGEFLKSHDCMNDNFDFKTAVYNYIKKNPNIDSGFAILYIALDSLEEAAKDLEDTSKLISNEDFLLTFEYEIVSALEKSNGKMTLESYMEAAKELFESGKLTQEIASSLGVLISQDDPQIISDEAMQNLVCVMFSTFSTLIAEMYVDFENPTDETLAALENVTWREAMAKYRETYWEDSVQSTDSTQPVAMAKTQKLIMSNGGSRSIGNIDEKAENDRPNQKGSQFSENLHMMEDGCDLSARTVNELRAINTKRLPYDYKCAFTIALSTGKYILGAGELATGGSYENCVVGAAQTIDYILDISTESSSSRLFRRAAKLYLLTATAAMTCSFIEGNYAEGIGKGAGAITAAAFGIPGLIYDVAAIAVMEAFDLDCDITISGIVEKIVTGHAEWASGFADDFKYNPTTGKISQAQRDYLSKTKKGQEWLKEYDEHGYFTEDDMATLASTNHDLWYGLQVADIYSNYTPRLLYEDVYYIDGKYYTAKDCDEQGNPIYGKGYNSLEELTKKNGNPGYTVHISNEDYEDYVVNNAGKVSYVVKEIEKVGKADAAVEGKERAEYFNSQFGTRTYDNAMLGNAVYNRYKENIKNGMSKEEAYQYAYNSVSVAVDYYNRTLSGSDKKDVYYDEYMSNLGDGMSPVAALKCAVAKAEKNGRDPMSVNINVNGISNTKVKLKDIAIDIFDNPFLGGNIRSLRAAGYENIETETKTFVLPRKPPESLQAYIKEKYPDAEYIPYDKYEELKQEYELMVDQYNTALDTINSEAAAWMSDLQAKCEQNYQICMFDGPIKNGDTITYVCLIFTNIEGDSSDSF